ncbi:MAG TPA: glycosyl hydrolase-related protein [Armatimonadota bacterium]|nr:glycosyl hydrolase-related protein [Armatimonadota bacterium]
MLTRSLALPGEWRGGSPFRPQQSFVDVSDGQRGIAVFNQGLPEYEGKTDVDRTIALTLVRGVGHLSDADAPGSPETPGAQCLGRQVCRYAIYPHAGSWEEADVWQQAHAFNTPVRCVQATEHPGELPANASLLELRPNNLVLSAVKRAEDEEAVIVRFYNPTAVPAEGDLRLHFPVTAAYRANLNEECGEALPVSDDGRRIHVTARGKEIVTLLLLP